MVWVLIGLLVTATDTQGIELGRYDNLDACFKAREVILDGQEFPPVNTQFVCVQFKGDAI